MEIQQLPVATGTILWLGVNVKGEKFSQARSSVIITHDGIVDDKYRGMWRKLSAHDVDYINIDGVKRGDTVLNLRQITITDDSEVAKAGDIVEMDMLPEHLRPNIVVKINSITAGMTFSKLPPNSRLVIGDVKPKVLLLTEENGPCATIVNPIASLFERKSDADLLKQSLRGRRGQMSMVKSYEDKCVSIGDTFKIFPPLT